MTANCEMFRLPKPIINNILRSMRKPGINQQALTILCAFSFGVILGIWLSRNAKIVRHVLKCQHRVLVSGKVRAKLLKHEVNSNVGLLLVAVFMSTHLRTQNTFYEDFNVKTINIKLILFSSETKIFLNNKEVVHLDGIDKSTKREEIYLRMFSKVNENYGLKFNWFMFAESGFFVNIAKLSFLRFVNHSDEFILLPQATVNGGNDGYDRKNNSYRDDIRGSDTTKKDVFRGIKEHQMLDNNFTLILQPGLILSGTLLHKLSSSTEPCIRRRSGVRHCFQKRVRISWLTDSTQYDNITESKASGLNSISCRSQFQDITRTVTADVADDLECLHRLRVQILSKRVRVLSRHSRELEMKSKILRSFVTTEIRDKTSITFRQKVEHGTMFTVNKNYPVNTKIPWSIRVNHAKGVLRTISTVMDTISNAHRENIQFNALYYGYVLNQPITGLQYRLDILTNKERHIAQCRHEFGALQSRLSKTHFNITIHIVVPLAGKLENFKQFLKNLEQRILKEHESISILVVYFSETTTETNHRKIFQKYNMTYTNSTFTWLSLQGKFARARALQAAVNFYQDNKLMFFADVDLTFNTHFLQRCRDNAIAKKRVYFPVMFKLFNPKFLGSKLNETNYFQLFQRDVGDWALHSYGAVCVYRDDVISVGGFNVHISEWGYEDIQLFERFIQLDYDVIRVADTGLLHIYHTHTKCNVIKNQIQRLMCTGAMLNGLASRKSVLDYLLREKILEL